MRIDPALVCDEEYLVDLADQVDNLEMVDGRYDLTINIFLRALVIKEAPKGAPTKYIAELDETSGWAPSRPTTRATDLMVDDLAEFAFVDDDDDSPLTTDQDYGVEMGEGALRGRARALGVLVARWRAAGSAPSLQASGSPTSRGGSRRAL